MRQHICFNNSPHTMKFFSPLIPLAAMILAVPVVQAAFIDGSVIFSSGIGGGVVLQNSAGSTTTSLLAATGVKSWVLPQVDVGSGSFGTLPGGADITFAEPWIFNPSIPTSPLWTIAGPENFSFHLVSSTIVFQSRSFLSVTGSGVLKGTGFEDTPGTWTFTTQGRAANNLFSWSSSAASSNVPDGGMTVALMGGVLAGLFGIQRKLRKR